MPSPLFFGGLRSRSSLGVFVPAFLRGPSFPLFLGRRLGCALAGIFLAEFLDAARSIDDLLLAGIERVARRAHLHMQVLVQRGSRGPRVAAAAGDSYLTILGM